MKSSTALFSFFCVSAPVSLLGGFTLALNGAPTIGTVSAFVLMPAFLLAAYLVGEFSN